MQVETRKYVRKPLIVNGVRVTTENFKDVAEWCKGCIRWIHDGSELSTAEKPSNASVDPLAGVDPIDPDKQYIQVEVINPRSLRQQKAYVGDWILHTESGFKIYTHKAFTSNFDECTELTQPSGEEWANRLMTDEVEVQN